MTNTKRKIKVIHATLSQNERVSSGIFPILLAHIITKGGFQCH